MANWWFSLLGKASGNVAEVDADNQLLVTTNQDPAKAGATRLYDSQGNEIAVEENGALSVSQDELILSEQVDGTALNTNKWLTSVSTMTVAQAAGFIVLNAGASVASGAYAILNSIMNIPLYGDMPVEFVFSAKINTQPIPSCALRRHPRTQFATKCGACRAKLANCVDYCQRHGRKID